MTVVLTPEQLAAVARARFALQIVGPADGSRSPVDGWWVRTYDPTAPPVRESSLPAPLRGRALTSAHCALVLVEEQRWARSWETAGEAMNAWRAECPCGGGRVIPDGRPCRPLTAYPVEVVRVEPRG